jgi:hypothetical protein
MDVLPMTTSPSPSEDRLTWSMVVDGLALLQAAPALSVDA